VGKPRDPECLDLFFTPKVLLLKAQGCEALRATLGDNPHILQPCKGCTRENLVPQSLSQIYLHIVYSTKDRRPFLRDPLIRNETHDFLGGTCNDLGCPVLRVGGVADHVHILCRFGRSISVSDLIKELKRKSSLWIKTKSAGTKDFYWQNGFGAFSVSPGHVNGLIDYITNQEEHHRKETFQEEFRRLLTKYGLEWDERFVWD
jgi:putative transposase